MVPVVEEEIKLSIESPYVANMALIDVPGITTQNSDIVKDIVTKWRRPRQLRHAEDTRRSNSPSETQQHETRGKQRALAIVKQHLSNE